MDQMLGPDSASPPSISIATASSTRGEWDVFRAMLASENGLLAITLGGEGDMTEHAIRWKYQRPVPQVPSTLLYKGVLFMVNDSGILIAFDPATGDVLKQGRLKGAIDKYFASPVGADGKVWLVSQDGTVSVVSAKGDVGDPRGQRARRRGVCDAGAGRRTALRADAQRAVRVWRGTVRRRCPERTVVLGKWCALLDSNQGPPPCEGDALPLSQARTRACRPTIVAQPSRGRNQSAPVGLRGPDAAVGVPHPRLDRRLVGLLGQRRGVDRGGERRLDLLGPRQHLGIGISPWRSR